MRWLLLAVMAAVIGSAWAQTGEYKKPETIPGPPVVQPVAFSHKLHVEKGLNCRACHTLGGEGFAAGIPKESFCLGCHTTVKADSPEIAKLKQPVDWVRIYRVPDFVWFNHASHVKDAKIECAQCHGDVAARDVLAKEKPTTMASCMDCHQARKAPIGCDFCHATQ